MFVANLNTRAGSKYFVVRYFTVRMYRLITQIIVVQFKIIRTTPTSMHEYVHMYWENACAEEAYINMRNWDMWQEGWKDLLWAITQMLSEMVKQTDATFYCKYNNAAPSVPELQTRWSATFLWSNQHRLFSFKRKRFSSKASFAVPFRSTLRWSR